MLAGFFTLLWILARKRYISKRDWQYREESFEFCNMNYRYVLFKLHHYPANKYMFRVSNRNTRKSCEICSKLTIKTPERCQIYFTPFSSVSIVNLKQTNIFWDKPFHLLLCYLTFSSPCIFKSCSKIKINLNFYFHTSL